MNWNGITDRDIIWKKEDGDVQPMTIVLKPEGFHHNRNGPKGGELYPLGEAGEGLEIYLAEIAMTPDHGIQPAYLYFHDNIRGQVLAGLAPAAPNYDKEDSKRSVRKATKGGGKKKTKPNKKLQKKVLVITKELKKCEKKCKQKQKTNRKDCMKEYKVYIQGLNNKFKKSKKKGSSSFHISKKKAEEMFNEDYVNYCGSRCLEEKGLIPPWWPRLGGKQSGGKKKWTPIKVKSGKPMTLEQLRKKAIKKNRASLVEVYELDLIVAQEKDGGTKYKFIFDGSALVDGKYVSDFLLSGQTQKKGQLVFLNGVSKGSDDKHWSPEGVQICDNNVVAWRCMGGTMIYQK